mgnify:CR=1 FL=1
MTAWDTERKAHGIILMHNYILICACGAELTVLDGDKRLHQRLIYDILLDNHKRHAEKRKLKEQGK